MNIIAGKLTLTRKKLKYRGLGSILRKKNTQGYTMLVLSLFTISFFGFLAIRPTLKTVVGLKKQIQDYKEADEKLTGKINQLVSAQAEYEFISPFVPKIKRAFPENPDYFGTLKDLDDIKNDLQEATISSITIGKIVLETQEPGKLEVKVRAQGGYLPLETLIDTILKNERLMTVIALNIGKKGNEEKTQYLEADTQIEASFSAKTL